MPGSTGPNLGLVWGYSPHEDGWGVGSYNPGFALLDSLVQLAVIDTLVTPPGSPANGDRYIVGASATGAWSGQDGKIAVYLTIGTPGWTFFTPKEGWRAFDIATLAYTHFDGANWISEADSDLITATKTTNYLVTTADNFKHFNNIGATGEVDFTLPAAAANLTYTFVVYAAQVLKVIADGSDLVKGGDTFSAGNISSNQPYSSLTLEAHGAGIWITSSTVGNWG